MMVAGRILREKKTISVMVSMYCRAHHSPGSAGSAAVCARCRDLLAYAQGRIDHCVFRDAKPACNRCRVHCYARPMREEIRAVMRFAGPRMMGAHPVLALLHLAGGVLYRQGGRRSSTAGRGPM
jgi:hypothetical protein